MSNNTVWFWKYFFIYLFMSYLPSGLDYKKLMDSDTSPLDVLRPCLTAANINTLAKLSSQIPDKVSIVVICKFKVFLFMYLLGWLFSSFLVCYHFRSAKHCLYINNISTIFYKFLFITVDGHFNCAYVVCSVIYVSSVNLICSSAIQHRHQHQLPCQLNCCLSLSLFP